ncbi:hypothetical protein WJX73_006582 [Symbiochloris irregularis]|uniref:Trafficking protein particle complex subunit 6B n=1 Tax=Symbiochloris irregularis TaxID=706552 RepID=A0AAW1NSY3_9CHLO
MLKLWATTFKLCKNRLALCLGLMEYDKGFTPENREAAAKFYRKAARLGDTGSKPSESCFDICTNVHHVTLPPNAQPVALPNERWTVMALAKSRQCSESCLELFAIELVNHYTQQTQTSTAASIDAIGFRVGRQLAERYTANRPRFGDPLDVIKFVCKEFWTDLFRKQVDGLRTNHRGTFVLKDHNFRWLSKLSPDPQPNGLGVCVGGGVQEQSDLQGMTGIYDLQEKTMLTWAD